MGKSTWKERIGKFMAIVLVFGIVLSSVNIQQTQAASKKTYYYGTVLNRTKGGLKNGYWRAGTAKVTYTSKSVTFYASFMRSNKTPIANNKKNFVKYGKRTFKLTSRTKYYYSDALDRIPAKKYDALRCCKSLNGLMAGLEIKNGKVVSLTFFS